MRQEVARKETDGQEGGGRTWDGLRPPALGFKSQFIGNENESTFRREPNHRKAIYQKSKKRHRDKKNIKTQKPTSTCLSIDLSPSLSPSLSLPLSSQEVRGYFSLEVGGLGMEADSITESGRRPLQLVATVLTIQYNTIQIEWHTCTHSNVC